MLMKYILAILGIILIAVVCAFAIIGALWVFSEKPEDDEPTVKDLERAAKIQKYLDGMATAEPMVFSPVPKRKQRKHPKTMKTK